MEIRDALQNLGLNEKESRVYTALLQLGQTSAYVAATKSGLKKPTTYVVLEELIKKGLVRQIPRRRKALYEAKSPEEVFALAEERLEVAKKALPELLALATKGEAPKIRALYFEGVEGIKQILQYGLKEMKGKEIVGFAAYASEQVPKELMDYFDEYNDRLKRWNIHIRAIAPDHPSLESYRARDKEFGRGIKTVPFEKYSSETSIEVTDNAVRVMDFANLQGIAIDNPNVAKTMREIFEMVWEETK